MPASVALGVLAGGRGERFGGRDKGWIEVSGTSQIERILAQLRSDVGQVMVSANRNQQRYRALEVEVVEDRWPDHPGPMAGIVCLLERLRLDLLLTVPVDVATIPPDLVTRMLQAQAIAPGHGVQLHDEDGLQPLLAVYPAGVAAQALRSFESGVRAVREWQRQVPMVACHFSGIRLGNFNSPEDLPT